MGWVEACSRLAAMRRQAASSRLPSGRQAATTGWPKVSVPVLSSTTRRARASASSASARVTSSPRRARAAVAAVIAVGVASDSAQGQVTTRTARVVSNARLGSTSIHAPATHAATSSTPATNHDAQRSASLAIAGRSVWARSSSLTIPARTVSWPTAVTAMRSGLPVFSEPPSRTSPSRLATAADSPVSMDSSTAAAGSSSMPSAGRASPEATRTVSPGESSATATRSVAPSRSRVALTGCMRSSASLVLPAR